MKGKIPTDSTTKANQRTQDIPGSAAFPWKDLTSSVVLPRSIGDSGKHSDQKQSLPVRKAKFKSRAHTATIALIWGWTHLDQM
jgi:hypothetical protein